MQISQIRDIVKKTIDFICIGKLQQGGDFVLDAACELAAHVISDCDLLTKQMEGTQNGK